MRRTSWRTQLSIRHLPECERYKAQRRSSFVKTLAPFNFSMKVRYTWEWVRVLLS